LTGSGPGRGPGREAGRGSQLELELELRPEPGSRPGPLPRIQYSPVQLARLLDLAEPTAEQAAVISAPAAPLAVIAGAGSGKSETMAARLVWLVANGLVRPERVLGSTNGSNEKRRL